MRSGVQISYEDKKLTRLLFRVFASDCKSDTMCLWRTRIMVCIHQTEIA